MPPAARVTDPTVHLVTPLAPGPGSFNVFIGNLPAWRALPAAAAAGLQAAKTAADTAVQTAQAATVAAAGTPGAPAAVAAEEATKAATLASMSAAISSAASASATPSGGMPDIHACPVPMGLVPHGPGVVIDGSPTVLINGLPASRMGDTVLEALGPANKIMMGMPTVIIGNAAGSASSGGSSSIPAKASGGGAPGGPGAPTGGATPAQVAPTVYKTKPTLDDLLKDPFVDQELKKAWNDSNPNAPEVKQGDPGSTKVEQGGGFYWNKKTGEMKVIRVPATSRDGNSGAPAATGDWEKVAEFHTHPNTSNEGYSSDPSPADRNYVKNVSKVPEIIETHDGRKTIPYP